MAFIASVAVVDIQRFAAADRDDPAVAAHANTVSVEAKVSRAGRNRPCGVDHDLVGQIIAARRARQAVRRGLVRAVLRRRQLVRPRGEGHAVMVMIGRPLRGQRGIGLNGKRIARSIVRRAVVPARKEIVRFFQIARVVEHGDDAAGSVRAVGRHAAARRAAVGISDGICLAEKQLAVFVFADEIACVFADKAARDVACQMLACGACKHPGGCHLYADRVIHAFRVYGSEFIPSGTG